MYFLSCEEIKTFIIKTFIFIFIIHQTNKEASTVLCSVVKHLGSGRAQKKCRGSALPLPKCFTTEQSTVEASLFVNFSWSGENRKEKKILSLKVHKQSTYSQQSNPKFTSCTFMSCTYWIPVSTSSPSSCCSTQIFPLQLTLTFSKFCQKIMPFRKSWNSIKHSEHFLVLCTFIY